MANYRRLKRYWSPLMQQRFFHRFTELIEHGFSISEALDVMAILFRSDMVNLMIESCQKGYPFANSLESSTFEQRVVYIVRCNEEAGSLLQGLQRAKSYTSLRIQNQKEFRKKLYYPGFLFLMMLVILVSLYLFFIPQIDSFYMNFNIENDQPAIKGIIFIIGVTFSLLFTLFLLIIIILKLDNAPLQKTTKTWLFKGLGVRQLSQKLFSYYFSSQWLMLLECGLPFKESLATIKSFEKIPLIRLIISEFERRLNDGESLDSLINSSPYFTPYFKLMMTHSLKIGCIHKELVQFTTSELSSLNALITTSFKVFQTVSLLLIGSTIILLYLSILQPVFEMVQLL